MTIEKSLTQRGSREFKRYLSRFRKNVVGYLFILPIIIGLAFIFIPAMVDSLMFSFQNVTFNTAGVGVLREPVGWENYHHAFNVDVHFRQLLITILTNMAVNLPVILIFSFLIANLINQKFPGRGFVRMTFFLPVIIGAGVVARLQDGDMLLSIFGAGQVAGGGAGATNIINLDALVSFYRSLGLGGAMLDYVIMSVNRLYIIIVSSGVQIVVFLSALQAVPESLYEASKVEGCSGWESFWKITLPIVSPIILVNTVYTIIDSFIDPRNELTSFIHDVMFSRGDFGFGAAMTWMYFLASALILAVIAFIVSRLVVYYDA